MFKGSYVALITPFVNGKVDDKALKQLVEWHIAEGTHGIVPVGTTGESPTLSHEEHEHVIKTVVDTAAGRVPCYCGCGFKQYGGIAAVYRICQRCGRGWCAGCDAVLQ